ncbi:hypothetical protein ESP47_06430 [Heyndrickxia coagulans]|uniref:Uncharacterized protein n=1 Tax=Heyndrickxia coagulans TaxID=1398 RepID=A0AAN0WBN8_HEYCO|nr:hypothetical protein SB48_HM08orf02699 [Heyndrickxia coagulans]AKN55976.1 hypothetical protein AB434_3571 [Heyndrickxia coagulans]QAU26768.1 hypothetical protein ESP47_06430 [Heyndrickxia coagulans]
MSYFSTSLRAQKNRWTGMIPRLSGKKPHGSGKCILRLVRQVKKSAQIQTDTERMQNMFSCNCRK